MKPRKKPPRLRARLTLFTTLLSVCALLILGGALILAQSRVTRAATRAEIEYAMGISNAAVRAKMDMISRVIRDLRNASAFAPLYAGEEGGAALAREGLAYTADLYSDQNLASASQPFLRAAALFYGDEIIACAYFPATQAQRAASDARMRALRDAFLSSGEEWRVVAGEENLCLLTRLYALDMKPLGAALFEIGTASVRACFDALNKYEGAGFLLADSRGTRLAGEAAEAGCLAQTLSLPFGLRVTACVPEGQIGRLVRPALISMAAIMLLLIPVVALIAFLIAYRVSKPLKEVAQRIAHVEAGDYTAKLKLPGFDEFENIGARFNAMTDTIRHLVTEVYEKQLLAKESEIKFLQSQMNPHFMYNVLAMIAMTAKRNGDEEAYRLLRSFASLARARVFTGDARMIPLEKELGLVNDYLFLQCKRYEDRIRYEIQCDDALLAIPVPRLCIEPIAENAFLHGMEPKGAGRVTVRAARAGDRLTVTVADDGAGFSPEARKEGVGLSNTRKILQNVFGARAEMRIQSAEGAGTVVTVTMPVTGEEARDACGA